jgi:hypothetical protein
MLNIRPLKITLHDDDVLFYLHIPKTAGLSLIALLDAHFRTEEIFPLHSAPSPEMFEVYSPEQIAGYRLVRGHFDFGPYDNGIYKHITPNPICLTMLREPISRTISHYRHNLRHDHGRWHDVIVAQKMSLKDFVCSPDTYAAVVNHQTRLLVGKVKGNPQNYVDSKALSEEAMLSLAKERLEQFAFFGLIERFHESILLLSHTFGWKPVEAYPMLNKSPEPSDPDSIPPEALEAIIARTRLDAELYQYAQQLFEARLNRMAEESLLERSQTI